MDRSLLGSVLLLLLGLCMIALGVAGWLHVLSEGQALVSIALLMAAVVLVRVGLQGRTLRPNS